MEKANLICVCEFCRNHNNNALIEINFADKTIYYFCSSCEKMNKMDLSKPLPPSYPKSKRIS